MRKDCKIISELMPLYVDGVCDRDVMMYIEEHLKVCNKCKSAYDIFSGEEFTNIEKYNDIDEDRVFLKVKRKNKRKVIVGVVIAASITLLLGTNLTTKFTKYRFNKYVNKNFQSYDLEVANFRYDDPESNGFGLNNGFYIADVYAKNEKKNPDVRFNIYTDGAFLKIKDNYNSVMEEKVMTKDRIGSEYSKDIRTALYKYGEVKDVGITIINDKNIEVDMEYSTDVDKKLDMKIKLSIYEKDGNNKNISKIVDDVNKELKAKGFIPKIYDIEIINSKEDNIVIENIKSSYKNVDELESDIVKKINNK